MTPIDLARTIGKLLGAPTPVLSRLDTAYQRTNGLGWRDPDGLGWIQDPADFACHMLDLDDAATGGVLLARLGSGWLIYQRDHDRQWEVARPDGADKQEGPTLAIALARLILARGSWT